MVTILDFKDPDCGDLSSQEEFATEKNVTKKE